MKLFFYEPSANWLPTSIELGGKNIAFAASAVLNNPLMECAMLALNVVGRQPTHLQATFWLEPDAYVLRTLPRGEGALVQLCPGRFLGRAVEDLEPALAEEFLPARLFASLILEALEAVEPLVRGVREQPNDEKFWSQPFPNAEVALLRSALT